MRPGGGWVPILQVDGELAARLPREIVDEAAHLAIAPAEWLHPREWNPPPPAAEDRASHLGLLVVDGFFARRVRVLDRPATELLGPGDLLLPWEPDRTEPFSAGARWEVLEQARIAVLDRRFTALLRRWPDITAAPLRRAGSRSRAFAPPIAINPPLGGGRRPPVRLLHLARRRGAQ